MNTTIARQLGDFPQFWWISAGVYLLIAVYLVNIGYRRFRGRGGFSFLERIALWTNNPIKGKMKDWKLREKILADTKKNKLYGLSAIFVAISLLVAAVISAFTAVIVTNAK